MANDKDAILILRDRAKKHKELYDVYSKAADQLEVELGSLTNNDGNKDTSHKKNNTPTMTRTKYGGLTFKEAIIKAFDTNTPYTAKQLLKEYKKLTSRPIKYSAFSGQLSVLKKNHESIKMQEIKENPLNSRFIYGLSAWFNGDKLKLEYLDKFRSE